MAAQTLNFVIRQQVYADHHQVAAVEGYLDAASTEFGQGC
jgi:hypothetical protein